ncbi:MAG: DUF3800 domain-containing protein [Bauldia sp.]
MYLCYIDESGTPEIPGNTSHFVLAGLSMPIWHWRAADNDIISILNKYDLATAELHTAWMMRRYLEQSKIADFEKLSRDARRKAVGQWRNAELLRLQKLPDPAPYRQAKKNFRHSEAYIHLTHNERMSAIRDVADLVGGWGFARLFVEAIDKIHFDPTRTHTTVVEQAFEQVVSRYHQYLVREEHGGLKNYGLLVHDNNESVAKKHTDLMRKFHSAGTLWTEIDRIIETPLFVDSRLTRMVQLADLCSVAMRRYVENNESDLFDRIFPRGDHVGARVVGVRHYTDRKKCSCKICTAHSAPIGP